ncbi:MAG TPA: type 2 lanthipeptide synthetase LanM family protein [Thermoanaerobaculia bacterium]|nr:type 2 lanthipeptide synthetase LanM family protein [Thermoanaerobaculia bacterium]
MAREQLWESPDWFRALTLTERAEGLPGRVDPDRAARRLARWQAQPPFSAEGAWINHLAADGLSEASFLSLLGEPDADLARRQGEPPPWLLDLERSFSNPAPQAFPTPSMPERARPHVGFLEAVRPLLDDGYSRLCQGVLDLAAGPGELPFDPQSAPAFFAAGLAQHLILLMSRTMVLELNLARREGRLSGETSEARFESFVASLRSPAAALAVLRQYPVLARQVAETVNRWVEVSLELLRHLRDDAEELRAVFSPARHPGPLVALETGLGDSHRGGRTVAALTFASGLRLIYKPKPMGVETAFQELLAWTVRKGFEPAFRLLRVVDRGDHGWVEWVEMAPCATAEELTRFYRRQGGYLALLYLLAATDFHNDNLIAAGEHPVLLDLEALFHPWVAEIGNRPGETLLGRPLFESVLQSGMLPARSRWGAGEEASVDLSGLAAPMVQMTPQAVLATEAAGTDAMRFVRRPVELSPGKSRPTLNGAEVALCDFLEPLVDGFVAMYRLLASHREELAGPGGPLAAFAEAEVRVIVRMTRTYGTLFMEGQHPFVLGDALDRDRLFDRLWELAEEWPRLAALVPAERRSLLRGDIPMFTAQPGSRDLWISDGERLPGFLPVSGLDEVRTRLGRFDEADLQRQVWIIRNAIEAVFLRSPADAPPAFSEAPVAPSRDEILETARAVGRRLEELSFRAPGEAHWFAAKGQAAPPWNLTLAGLDLHLGLPGIVLFLSYLGTVTNECHWTELAREGAATLRLRAASTSRQLDQVGAFSGWGGPIYVLTHLASLWDDPALLDEAEALVSFLPELIDADTWSDVVAGAAGCLVCLLRLWEQRPAPATLAAAVRCGERLLARAVPMASGIGWRVEPAGPVPLAGMSHGAAGIAWALLQLAAATGDQRFREAAEAGLAYERSLYVPERRNWPDLRSGSEEPDGSPNFLSTWCHGAPGIALARLDGLRHLDDGTVREEISVALETTLREGFGRGHCQCHGDLGNLEPLLLAQDRLGLDLAPRIGRLLGGTLADLRACGWRFGMHGRTEPPGFMLGLAGIGYGLLRHVDPQRVPPVVVLAPPAPRERFTASSPSEIPS